MQSQTTVKKPKLKIKLSKTKKTKIEDKLNSLYPNSDLFKKELNYDIDIPEEFRKMLNY